jgi:hypothetical protein
MSVRPPSAWTTHLIGISISHLPKVNIGVHAGTNRHARVQAEKDLGDRWWFGRCLGVFQNAVRVTTVVVENCECRRNGGNVRGYARRMTVTAMFTMVIGTRRDVGGRVKLMRLGVAMWVAFLRYVGAAIHAHQEQGDHGNRK